VTSVDDEDLAADELIAYCRERIAHYKCPTVVVTVAELPKTATGKISKVNVRRLVEDQTSHAPTR
jgi:fatty-acyl-CoA synthase